MSTIREKLTNLFRCIKDGKPYGTLKQDNKNKF